MGQDKKVIFGKGKPVNMNNRSGNNKGRGKSSLLLTQFVETKLFNQREITMITLQKIWVKAVSVVMLLSAFAVSAGGYGYKKNKDIVDVAASNQSFTTLVAAVKAAGLVDTLKGKGPYTVFAPTNEAFAKLPAGTVESLLKPENKDKLIAILTYHVVPSKFYAKQVVNIDAAKTVQGSSIDITAMNGKVMVDNAKVIKTDIKASNGVIHVIDNVIIPSDKATVARHH